MEFGCEAGLKPSELWCCTIPEIISMISGYQKRLYHEYSISRDIRYSIYCVVTDPNRRVEIYDWQPLEGDPSKEEREKIKVRQQLIEQEQFLNDVAYYKSQGIDVM